MEKNSQSTSKYVFGKPNNGKWANIKIINNSDVLKSFKIQAVDPDTSETLNVYAGEQEVKEERIDPKNALEMKIDTENVEKKVALELSFNGQGGGISIRQQSSNKAEKNKGIELILK